MLMNSKITSAMIICWQAFMHVCWEYLRGKKQIENTVHFRDKLVSEIDASTLHLISFS